MHSDTLRGWNAERRSYQTVLSVPRGSPFTPKVRTESVGSSHDKDIPGSYRHGLLLFLNGAAEASTGSNDHA